MHRHHLLASLLLLLIIILPLQAGCLKGVRLWHMASVREYIFTQMEGPQNSLAQGGLKPPLIRKERK